MCIASALSASNGEAWVVLPLQLILRRAGLLSRLCTDSQPSANHVHATPCPVNTNPHARTDAQLHAHCRSCFPVLTKSACCLAGTDAAQRPYLQPLQTDNLTHRELSSMGNSAEGQHQHMPGPLSDQQVLQASPLGQQHIPPAAATAGTAAITTGRRSHMATCLTVPLTKVFAACLCDTRQMLFVAERLLA